MDLFYKYGTNNTLRTITSQIILISHLINLIFSHFSQSLYQTVKMKFSTLAALVLAGTAVAAPHTNKRRDRAAERAAKRAAGTRHSNPINRIESSTSNNTNVEYSSNWAGAIIVGTGITSVTGEFTVPQPSTTGSGSAWVGIDGGEILPCYANSLLVLGMILTTSRHLWYCYPANWC